MPTAQHRVESAPLKVGDLVEVRRKAEILATLDENGALENLPFMPEMLRYCGRRFTVLKRADKTCDTASQTGMRRLEGTVHLNELRCDGSVHEGCEAGCMIFWKEAWLRKVTPGEPPLDGLSIPANRNGHGRVRVTEEMLFNATRFVTRDGAEIRYSCQATKLPKFSDPLPWWDVKQYLRDYTSGNVTLLQFAKGIFLGAYNKLLSLCGRCDFHKLSGTKTRTPSDGLGLRPGDLVKIKPAAHIRETLNPKGKNRGLTFTRDMVSFCGGEYRVMRRIHRIIDERNGRLINLAGGCLLLEGVVCNGQLNRFCPRLAYQFWRDIWLTKLDENVNEVPAHETPQMVGTTVSADSELR